MANVSMKLPERLNKRLADAARRRKRAKSEIIRQALEQFLAAEPDAPKRAVKKGSFLDVAGDLIGSVEGPGDLSTNPKYMEDFGR